MLNKDVIAFSKGYIILNETDLHYDVEAYTLQAELMNLGYMIEPRLIPLISRDRAIELYNSIIPYAKDLISDGYYEPLYSGFPNQIMELSTYDIFLDQIKHYSSFGTWKPNKYDKCTASLFERVDYKNITLCSEEQFNNIFTTLASANNSIVPFDLEIIEWFARNNNNLILPSKINLKEILCTLGGLGVPNIPITTVTDVLRIAVFMSGGDISLPAVNKHNNSSEFKFKKFNRSERRYLLSLLEETNCDVSEMKLKINRWVRLGEIIHPSQYTNIYPKASKAFNEIRNNSKNIVTFNSKILPLIAKGVSSESLLLGLEILTSRPGEFARRLDYLVRTHDYQIVLHFFRKISKGVSNKVLFELYNHFINRCYDNPRYVYIKGCRKPKQLKQLPELADTIISAVTESILNTIIEKLAEKEQMTGLYYIDKSLKNIPIPTNMRSISKGVFNIPRGTKIPLKSNANCFRFFLHWFDADGTEDLDLCTSVFNKSGSRAERISWNTSLLTSYGCHSGDVRFVQGHVAEYVDIDIKKAINSGFRYLVCNAYNYERRSLKTVNPTIGWMELENGGGTKAWKPEQVSNAISLNSDATACTAIIVDLEERNIIFVDEDINKTYSTNERTEIALMERYDRIKFISIYDILELNIKARGGSITPHPIEDTHVECTSFMFESFMKDYSKIFEFMD